MLVLFHNWECFSLAGLTEASFLLYTLLHDFSFVGLVGRKNGGFDGVFVFLGEGLGWSFSFCDSQLPWDYA